MQIVGPLVKLLTFARSLSPGYPILLRCKTIACLNYLTGAH